MFSNREKCINPWIGFLIISLVCIMIATAIFFEFKGTRHTANSHKKTDQRKNAVQVVFPNTVNDTETAAGDKLVF